MLYREKTIGSINLQTSSVNEKKNSEYTFRVNNSSCEHNVQYTDSEIADLSVKVSLPPNMVQRNHYYSNCNGESVQINLKLSEKPKSTLTGWNNVFKRILFDQNKCDFAFVVGGEKIYVNKFILSVRSPFFDKMFNSGFKESKCNEHALEYEISKEAFKELIRYIYTEEVKDLSNHVMELLHASDFYGIPELKLVCEKKITEILTEENANEIFQAAHSCNCSMELKKCAFQKLKGKFRKHNFELKDELIDHPQDVDTAAITIKNLASTLSAKTKEINNNKTGLKMKSVSIKRLTNHRNYDD